jgi:tetratricopeptide (TPR) repeat protein
MPVDDSTLASAIRRQEERLQRDPTSLAFAQLADLYRKVGRAPDAVAMCREGLARYPQYTTARIILTKALIAGDQLDEARAEVQTLLDTSPREPQAHRLAAEIHRRRGQVDAALEHLDAAVRLDPADRESRALLGLLRAVDTPAAESAGLPRVLADDTFVTTTFAAVCLDQGLVEEAAQVFTRILRKNPDNREARDGLERALRARSRRKG